MKTEEKEMTAEVRTENIRQLLRKVDEVMKLAQEIGIDSGILGSIVSNAVVIEPYQIIDLVQKKLKVNVSKKDRSRETIEARQVAIYLLRKFSRLPLQRIGQYVALADHSGVLHHLKVMEGYLSYDERLQRLIESFESDIYTHHEKQRDEQSNGI
jgi:chromosomal replication initiator protein